MEEETEKWKEEDGSGERYNKKSDKYAMTNREMESCGRKKEEF